VETVQQLASDLAIEERTLRRLVAQGTLRCHRPTPRRLRLAAGEHEYLDNHWGMLSALRRAMRTERRVELAVLYGSSARGDEDDDSDLDLLVSFADEQPSDANGLASRLERRVERRVDVARLGRVEANAPLLLDRVLDEGRVITDRGALWPGLRERRRAIRARAERDYRRQMIGARQAIAELCG
jgi:predicted nucleotidyltransferase